MTGECKPLHPAAGVVRPKSVKVYSVSIVNARELGVTGWLFAVSSTAAVADQGSGPTGRHIVPVSGTSAGYV
jgi:hypothetical protein